MVIATSALGLAGCSDGDGAGNPLGGGSTGDITALLALLPEGQGELAYVTLDAQARETFGVGARAPLFSLGFVPPMFPGARDDAAVEAIGFDVVSDLVVGASTVGGGDVPAPISLLRTDGDPSEVVERIADDDAVAGAEEVDVEGGTYLRYLDDFELDVRNRPAFSPIGQSFRVAALPGDLLAHTVDDAGIEAVLALAAGEGESLADGPLGEIGRAFDDIGAVGAMFTDESDRRETSLDDDVQVPTRWNAAAFAVLDGDASGDVPSGRIAMALAYGSGDEAAAAAEVIERLVTDGVESLDRESLAERFTVESAEADGNVAIVVLATEQVAVWSDLIPGGTVLLAWR